MNTLRSNRPFSMRETHPSLKNWLSKPLKMILELTGKSKRQQTYLEDLGKEDVNLKSLGKKL